MERQPHIISPRPDTGELTIMDLFLKDVREIPLLNKEEEVSLFRRFEAGKKAAGRLSRANGNLSRKERDSLMMVMADANAAKEHLFRANLRLVISIAKKYSTPRVELLDSIQSGTAGLIRAINKYDHKRGNKFSTYATWWIRNEVQRGNATFERIIRIPLNTMERFRETMETSRRLSLQSGREPTIQELSRATTMRPKTITRVRQVVAPPLSLDMPKGEDGESSLGDFVETDESLAPNYETDRNILSQKMAVLLSRLTPQQERVVRMRFGLNGDRERTLREVGEKMGLTRERIRQIESKALAKIKAEAELLGLSEFLVR